MNPNVLSVAVMTHPARRQAAEELVERLAPHPVRIVGDPRPDERPSALRTALEAWATVPDRATHQLLVQDDARPMAAFLRHADTAIQFRGDCALAYYADWSSRNGASVRMATAVGASLVRSVPDYVPCVALSLPRKYADEFVEFGRAWTDQYEADDVVMLRYTEWAGLPVLLTVPSLVAHEQLPSLVGNDVKGQRNSACFLSEPSNEPDWSAAPLDGFRLMPFLKHGRAQVYVCTDQSEKIWESLPATDAASWTDLGPDELSAAHQADTDHLNEVWYEALHASIAPELLQAVWTTGFLIGHCRSRLEPFRTFWQQNDSRIDAAALRESLRTLAIGGLFPTVSHQLSTSLAEEFAQLTWHGLRAGDRWLQ